MNWVLGFRDAGCEVFWLESPSPEATAEEARRRVELLRSLVGDLGLADCVHLISPSASPPEGYLPLDVLADADLVVNLMYWAPADLLAPARRTVLIDIDPGMLQNWMYEKDFVVAPHDMYFTIGETVGRPGSPIPDCGVTWEHTRPPVHLPSWPVAQAPGEAAYTTVTHWWDQWVYLDGETFCNDKRESFLSYLALPTLVDAPLELCVDLDEDEEDRDLLLANRWRLADPAAVSTPASYRSYISASRGEFSCAKASCMRLQNAWISDRSLAYLASGKPVIVQHTGPSRRLPDAQGSFRFSTLEEAVRMVETVESDYERHCADARSLAEEFSAEVVARRLLERALP